MAVATFTHLIFSTLHPSPPSSPNSRRLPPPSAAAADEHLPPQPLPSSRRTLSLLLLSLSLSPSFPSPASAFGIPGPKEWLREQKRKAARFILAPIEASRGSLNEAYLALDSLEEVGKVGSLIRSASRDCVADERSSVVAFQARTGVEVCTFRLLVNNAASLLDERDPVKLETEAMLDQLIRSFASLGHLVDNSDVQVEFDRGLLFEMEEYDLSTLNDVDEE